MTIYKRIHSDKNIWIVSCICFIAGILLPMFTFSKFVFFNDTFSLLGGILHLLKEGEFFLFLVVFGFSIVGPLYKLKLIRDLISQKEKDKEVQIKLIKKLAIVGKWSMADVFVIAILVATVKLGMLASVSVHIGIVFFGIAVLLSMVLVQRQMSGYEFRPKEET
ncbi:MAG: paraquat-inducible protein A [Oceanospirillales bacterium]|nr:paraquat-inducible protein A [Oceanospirillales bacterium]MBR9888286.1 paraquat-inducible protein A [Oceanospirillales bacterium]